MMCFYCNEPETDRVYTSLHGARIDVHEKCVNPLKRLVKAQIYELTDKRKK